MKKNIFERENGNLILCKVTKYNNLYFACTKDDNEKRKEIFKISEDYAENLDVELFAMECNGEDENGDSRFFCNRNKTYKTKWKNVEWVTLLKL